MYNIEDFELYNSSQPLTNKSVLVWWENTGYYFMTFEQAQAAFKAGIKFIIKGVEK